MNLHCSTQTYARGRDAAVVAGDVHVDAAPCDGVG